VNVLKGIVNLFRFDKTNWQAVVLCGIAATVFWFFNALNKEHTATIAYPLEFRYDQASFISVKNLPAHVSLNITGSGWDLLRKSLGVKIIPIQISLDKPAETFKIPPATILPLAVAQMGQTKINHVANDTLFLKIEPRKKRKLRLTVSPRQLRFELGFGISSEIKIAPDSVWVEGPKSRIENLPDSLVLPFPPARISQSIKTEIDLNADVPQSVTINPATAAVSFAVDELRDITKQVKVVVLPATPYRFQVSDDSVRLRLRLPASQRKAVNQIGFVALIDLRQVEPGVSKVVPAIKGLPAFVELLAVDSVTIRKY
jgi:hypothetical protein